MKKRNSRILDEMHETACGLHGAGLISMRRMGEFETLVNLDVQEGPPQKDRMLPEQALVGKSPSIADSLAVPMSSDNDFDPPRARIKIEPPEFS